MDRYSIKNILASSNKNQPITALDGRVAAHLQHDGKHYVISTPNQDLVPLPPIGHRQVRLRANLRYGLEDHCQWPQFLAPKYSHLPTIPSRPVTDLDPLAPLWWDPTLRDFLPSLTGIVTGLGTLVGPRLEVLRVLKDLMLSSVASYIASSPKPSDFAVESTYVLQNRVTNAFVRLASLKSSFTEMVFNVTEFQRHCLHLEGFLRYSKTYRARLDGIHRNAHEVSNLIGTFTTDAESAQRLFHAGVPVWYVEEWDGAPLIRNILNVVDVTMPEQILTMADHVPPFPTIYDGTMIGENRYAAIYTFALNRLISQNPFARPPLGSVSSSSSSNVQAADTSSSRGSSRTSSQEPQASAGSSSIHPSPWKQKKKSPANPNENLHLSGRNPFEPVANAHSPYGIPAWIEAVQSISYSRSTIADLEKCDSRFALPDPKLFLGSKNLQAYISTWLQIRMLWQGCLGTDGGALTSQEWRELLNLDPSNPPTSQTLTAQRRRKLYDKLVYTDTTPFAAGVQVALGHAPAWEGTTYPPGQPVPMEVVRQILWSLFELNFHLEFVALDRRLTTDLHSDPERHTGNQLFARETAIQQCFAAGIFKLVTIPSRNVGLSADRLEERLDYLWNFAKVLKSWPACPESITQFSARRQPGSIGPAKGVEVEREIAGFYSQQFWNHFGRAPQIPHRLYLPQ